MSDLTVERYRLVLTHDLIVGGKEVKADEKVSMPIKQSTTQPIILAKGYTNRMLDELFYRFREELKK